MTAPFFRLQLSVDGIAVVDRLLQGIEERGRAPFADSSVVAAVVDAFHAINAQAFATEGGSTDAGAWPQLAKRTQTERRRLGYGAAHPILRRTGHLEESLTSEAYNAIRVTPTSLAYQLAPEVDYFKYHQSTRPRTRLPRRAMVSLTADQRTQLVHPIRLYLTGHDPRAPRRPSLR
jgi:phage gpG-like protein